MNEPLERIVTAIPGPRSRALASELALVESRGITYLADDFPVFWASAEGATVTDVDGNRYVDLTAAFGVAGVGHSNPVVAEAIAAQAHVLVHGMGDVHPSAQKVELLRTLAALAPLDEPRSYLCSSGAEAVEFALKTAYLATGSPDTLAFAGGYHGLTLGALEVGGGARFRRPFEAQLRGSTAFVTFPSAADPGSLARAIASIDAALAARPSIGAVLAEPIQGRAGVVLPPDGFLTELRRLCTRRGVLLILDEIYTGFGRTGTMFACEREGVRPDILCVGKAMSAGFPISAAIASRAVMDAWETSHGEALHTSTHLGNPLGCAAALAAIAQTQALGLCERARSLEALVEERLAPLRNVAGVRDARGRGLLWGVELKSGAAANRIVRRLLQAGIIALQSGGHGEVIAITPPLVIGRRQLAHALDRLRVTIEEEIA